MNEPTDLTDEEHEKYRLFKIKDLKEDEQSFYKYLQAPVTSLTCEERNKQLKIVVSDIRERIGILSKASRGDLNSVSFNNFLERLDILIDNLECPKPVARIPTPVPVTPVPPSPTGILDLIPQLTKTVIKSLLGNIEKQ